MRKLGSVAMALVVGMALTGACSKDDGGGGGGGTTGLGGGAGDEGGASATGGQQTGGARTGGATPGGADPGGAAQGGAPTEGGAAGALAAAGVAGAVAPGGAAGAPVTAGVPSVAGTPNGGAAGASIDPIFQLDCGLFGDACERGGDCCSGLCTDGVCSSRVIECGRPGASCGTSTDCCNLSCVDSECSADACTADGDACAEDGACCSGTCGTDGACVPLNTSCKTAGNPCTDVGPNSTQCCSGLCGEDGTCSRGGSFCVQVGDICRSSGECCTADCVLGDNGVGTCGAIDVGSANCDTVEGMLCNDCGGCCSRVCAPNALTGVMICQPARGCRVMGDLCRADTDCCGVDGTGLPGEGNVTCLKASPDDAVGICRSPTGCSPQGNVCHYKDYVCSSSSSRNNCCGATGESGRCAPNAAGELVCGGTSFLCQSGAVEGDACESCLLDPFGVPRCNGLSECRIVGDTCATAADCCDQMPCVPDEEGILRCGASVCIDQGGTCTVDADCCAGLPCVRPVGSTLGVCGEIPPPDGTGGAGGAPGTGGGAGTPAAGAPSIGGTGGTTPCSLYGQQCSLDADCCNHTGDPATNHVDCINGYCLAPIN